MEAYQKASDVARVSVRTIERWVNEYYSSQIDLKVHGYEVEDEDLDLILSLT